VPDGTGEHQPAATVSGAEGARRVLAVLQAFSPQRHTLTARELAGLTRIPLPSMYRYLALLRDTGLLAGDDRGAYHLTPRIIVCPPTGSMGGGGSGFLTSAYHYTCVNGTLTMYSGDCNGVSGGFDANGNPIPGSNGC